MLRVELRSVKELAGLRIANAIAKGSSALQHGGAVDTVGLEIVQGAIGFA